MSGKKDIEIPSDRERGKARNHIKIRNGSGKEERPAFGRQPKSTAII